MNVSSIFHEVLSLVESAPDRLQSTCAAIGFGEGKHFVAGTSGSMAHHPEQMLDVLRRHLLPNGDTPIQINECRIANTRRRDGSRGAIEYELQLKNTASGQAWKQRVTGVTYGGDRTRRVWDSICRSDAQRGTANVRSPLADFGYVPELDMLLQVFPHDHRLPAIASLTAKPPSNLVPLLLAEFGPGAWSLVEWTAETVQYRVDMRATLRLSVKATDGDRGRTAERQFYAKVYRDPEMGRRSHRVQRGLHDRAATAQGLLTIARPIAYLEELRTVVTTAVPGTTLSRLIRRGDGFDSAMRSAAKAVSVFHQLDFDAPSRSFADDVARLREAEEFLCSARPDLAQNVSDLVNAAIDGLAAAPVAVIHGDLKPEHILIDGDRVALIDFDLCGAADPVIDVAHLIAFLGKPLERARSRGDQPATAAQLFVDAYFANVPDSWRRRLPLYHAMTSIHRAVGLCRRRGAEGHDRVDGVLREGQALLAGDGDGSVPSYKRRLTRAARH